jgi:hypothetical protein
MIGDRGTEKVRKQQDRTEFKLQRATGLQSRCSEFKCYCYRNGKKEGLRWVNFNGGKIEDRMFESQKIQKG